MPQEDKEDTGVYVAVMNDEEQYSIWFADRQLPLGWRDAGKKGNKKACLDYIKDVWTDMRPLSLRKKMEASGHAPPPPTVDSNQPVTTQE
jgi:MbtH protein